MSRVIRGGERVAMAVEIIRTEVLLEELRCGAIFRITYGSGSVANYIVVVAKPKSYLLFNLDNPVQTWDYVQVRTVGDAIDSLNAWIKAKSIEYIRNPKLDIRLTIEDSVVIH